MQILRFWVAEFVKGMAGGIFFGVGSEGKGNGGSGYPGVIPGVKGFQESFQSIKKQVWEIWKFSFFLFKEVDKKRG